MAADFPTSLHDFSATYADSTAQATTHPGIHNDLNAELAAVQTKVGVDSSAVVTSLDYLVKNASSSNPGHKHTLADGATDVTATAAELNYMDGITAQTQILIPTGVVQMYGGASAPTGWLLCDGTAVSRTTYSLLYTAIGTNYGVGDGSTTFNVPDFTDNFPIGAGDTYSRGDTGGASTNDLSHTHGTSGHTLTESEMPEHLHTVNPPSKTTSVQSASHTHNQARKGSGYSYTWTQSSGGDYVILYENGSTLVTGNQSASHTHTVDIDQFNSGNAGSDGSHTHGDTDSGGSSTQENKPPYLGVYFIIKT